MSNTTRMISVPRTEKSAIDFLITTIGYTQIDLYNYIVINQSVLNSTKTCPVLKENESGIWYRKPISLHGNLLPELTYKVVPVSIFKEEYMISWIKYGDSVFYFSLEKYGRGISLSCASKERKRLYS